MGAGHERTGRSLMFRQADSAIGLTLSLGKFFGLPIPTFYFFFKGDSVIFERQIFILETRNFSVQFTQSCMFIYMMCEGMFYARCIKKINNKDLEFDTWDDKKPMVALKSAPNLI